MNALLSNVKSTILAALVLSLFFPAFAAAMDGDLVQGAALLEDGRLDEAEKFLRSSLEKAPEDVFAMNQLGLCLLKQGRFEAATVLFRRVLSLEEGNTFARLWLGAMHLREAQSVEAGNLFEQVLAVEPGNPDANYFMGVVAASEGRADEALGYFRKAGENAPRDVALQCRLARAFLKLDMEGDAEKAYALALEASPEDGAPLLGLGWLRVNQGQSEEGMELMRRALEDPESARDARESLAAAANQLAIDSCAGGDASQAIRFWNEALRHDPENRAARYHLNANAARTGVCKVVGGHAP